MGKGKIAVVIGLLVWLGGCAKTATNSYLAVSNSKAAIDPLLKASAYNKLLTFESKDDLLFVKTEQQEAAEDKAAPQIRERVGVRESGGLVLQSEVSIDLSTLVSGRTFPGRFELVGVYAKAAEESGVGNGGVGCIEAIYEVDGGHIGREFVQLNGVEAGGGTNGFTPVMVPLKQLGGRLDSPVQFERKHVLRLKPMMPVVLDNLVIIDNRKVLVGYEQGKEPFDGALVVTRRGLGVEVASEGKFYVEMDETQLSGWKLAEASSVRAIFEHANGDKRVIYCSGVDIWAGKWSAVMAQDPRVKGLSAGHDFPGRVVISEGRGRVDTLSPGDANNDGYNELTGSYRIVAQSKRLGITIEPSAEAIEQGGLAYPVVEITGLPGGERNAGAGVSVMLAGRKIREVARLADGRVVIVLPVVITGKATLSVAAE